MPIVSQLDILLMCWHDRNLTTVVGLYDEPRMRLIFTSSKNLARASLFVACALGMHCALAQTAESSCGDWLADSSMASDHANNQVPSEDGPAPCANGGCRNAPDFPLPHSPTRSFVADPDQWGNFSHILSGEQPAKVSHLWDRDQLVLEDAPLPRVDRPPQASPGLLVLMASPVSHFPAL